MSFHYIVEPDGNSWCAHDENFVNLQESNAAYGDTPQEALELFVKMKSEEDMRPNNEND